MATAVPHTPDHVASASWTEIQPLYDALATRPLAAAGVDAWLADWSALEAPLQEAASLAAIAYAADTADPAKEAAHLRFAREIEPRCEEQRVRLAGRLLDLGLDRPDLALMLRRFRTRRELFRTANVPVQQALADLTARYQRLTGEMTAPWEGEDLPLARLRPFLLDQHRSVRERAFRRQLAPFIARRVDLADLFDEQLTLRRQLAQNAGFGSYRDYAFRELDRFDYGPEDCLALHDAIAATVVPALARRYARRQQRLGVGTLRPWDTEVDPAGRSPLRPYDTIAELVSRTQTVAAHVDPAFGGYVATMAREGLFDLGSRAGKQQGGFCSLLPYRRRPFILLSDSGTDRTVEGLLHEVGHACHFCEVFALPLVFQWFPGLEMAEVASTTMELLTLPYLGQDAGGFYDAEDARRARRERLERILAGLAWIATVDAFQHWLYTNEESGDREARDAAWGRIAARFEPSVVEWEGFDAERVALWYRQPHIFLYPFYYIEYAIAQLGALQIWRNSRADERAAVAAYRRALALGDTRTLPELYATAGARLAFDAATLAELVGLIEEELAELDEPSGAATSRPA